MLRSLWTESFFHVVVSLSILNIGCVHSRSIPHESLSKEFDRINEELRGKRAQISLLPDSREFTAENVSLSADSVRYIETKTKKEGRIAITDIQTITTHNHRRGALEGFLGGLLTWCGMVAASIVLIGGKADPVEDGPGEGILVYYAFLAGTPMPIVGTLIGAATGSKKIYVFNEK